MEERIAMEADAERFTIVAWRHTNPSANSVCRSVKTRNTHSTVEARFASRARARRGEARAVYIFCTLVVPNLSRPARGRSFPR